MLDKVWKRISDKRPRGARLFKVVGALSGAVWIGAISVFLLLKGHPAGSPAEDLGHGGAEVASAGGEHHEAGGDPGAGTGGSSDGPAREVHGGEHAGIAAEPGSEGHHETETVAPAGETSGSGDASEGLAAEGGAADRPTPEEAAALRQVAELRFASGNMEQAVTPLRRVMKAPGQDPDLLAMAAEVFLATGNYPEAADAAGKLLSIRPDDMRAKVQAVEADYRSGHVEKAFAAAAAVIKEHPGELAMLTTLGTMEVEMGPGRPGYGRSLAAVLKLKPDYPPALYLKGRKAQLEGNYKDAETVFRKLLKIQPDNAKAHGQLGMALYHLGVRPEAEKEFRRELDMNPRDYNTWFNLGELKMADAADELYPTVIRTLRAEAMEAYLKAIELNPDHAEAQYRVGVLLNGNGQFKEAIRHLRAALKRDARHVPTLVQLALAYENLKQPEQARAYLTKAFELDPLNKVVLFKLRQWS